MEEEIIESEVEEVAEVAEEEIIETV